MKLSVVIPVYNEKDTILELLKRVMNVDLGPVQKEIVVVDDCSTDGTREILKNVQKDRPKLKVIFKEKNSGKGATLREGFKHTTGDYVIVQDADLEYNPKEYTKLLDVLSDPETQVVYGSRFSGNYEDMSNLHYFGNKLLTLITNIFYGVLLTDMETCYKLLPGDFIRNVKIKSNKFNFEPEITAKVLKSGLRIKEVPISYKGRSRSEGKHITWKDGISALITLIKFKFVE
jgi:glycosyltransferase involved in cell wall biosynthesis